MKLQVKGNTIELYDNTQNLPILRFQKFNKYMMMANEVGSTFEDYDQRMSRALAFLQKEMIKEAISELNNQRQAVFNSYNGFTPKGKAFAILVKRINEKEYTGISSDELDEVLNDLESAGLSNADSVEALEDIKKKSKLNLKFIFQTVLVRTKRLLKMLYKSS